MSNTVIEEKEVLLAEEIKEKFPLFLAIGPFFDNMLWFEQLIDLLGEIPNLELFIPEVRLFDGTEIEVNMFYQLLSAQFSARTFVVELPEESTLFELNTLTQHEYASEKITKFITSSHKIIDLASINSEISLLLAKQYESFLDAEIINCYRQYKNHFAESVTQYVAEKQRHQVFLLPIELMQGTLEFLKQHGRQYNVLQDYEAVFTKE